MSEIKKLDVPASPGNVTITIEEYRGLLEALIRETVRAELAEAESVNRGAKLYDKGQRIKELEAIIAAQDKRICELEEAAKNESQPDFF